MEVRKEIREIRRGRKNLIIVLATVIIASNMIILANSENLVGFTDISRILAIGSATFLSVMVIVRQGVSGIFGRTYFALAIGIILWLAAETTWGYYELVLQEERPFPSFADALWLAGYGPVGYHLFAMSKFYGRGVKKYKIVVVVAGIVIFSALYIQQLYSIFGDVEEGSELGLVISIAYPIFDAILFMPALIIVWNSGKGHLTSIPWIFISWISLGVADTLLGFLAVHNFEGDIFVINMFYLGAYFCMAAGLWWYNRFFIFDAKKVSKNLGIQD